MIREDINAYGFHFLDTDKPQMIALSGVGLEYRLRDYDWDNRRRGAGEWLFQYTLGGRGAVSYNGRVETVESGTALLLTLPGESRYYLPDGAKEGWRFVWTILSGPAADTFLGHTLKQYGYRFSLVRESSAIAALMQLYEHAATGKITNGLVAQEMGFRFLCRLTSSLCLPAQEQSTPVLRAQELIEKEFAAIESVQSIAMKVGVSPAHLSRSFTASTGTTLIEALTRARIRHAVRLLVASTITVEQVGQACGYPDGNYFGTVFRRVMGVSPAAFRVSAKAQGYQDVLL